MVVEALLLANHAAADTWAWRTTRWFTGDQDAFVAADYHAAHLPTVAATAPLYDRLPSPMQGRFYKRTEKLWRLFRDLGEPYIIVGLMAILWTYDPRRWKAALILLASGALAGGVGALIAVTAGRYRPIVTDGLNRWELFRGFHPHAGDLSWPSGHATLVFALAAALTVLSPRGKWLFVTLSLCCATTRVVMQAHFWSDALFGAVLGWSIGWATATLLTRTTTTLPPPPRPAP